MTSNLSNLSNLSNPLISPAVDPARRLTGRPWWPR